MSDEYDPEAEREPKEPRKADLRDRLARMTDIERRVLHLFETEGLTYTQITRKCGITLAEARRCHQRALDILAMTAEQMENFSADEAELQRVELAVADELAEWSNKEANKRAQAEMERVRLRSLKAITPQKLMEASAKANMQIADLATQNIQLLKGEPTAIVTINEVKKLDELGEALVRVMMERGMIEKSDHEGMIDITPTEVAEKDPVE